MMRILPAVLILPLLGSHLQAGNLRGSILDDADGSPLPARVYLRGADGKYHHVQSAAPEGSAVDYSIKKGIASEETHTTLSAHPFVADLPDGDYTLTVVRGKEYHEETRPVTIPGAVEVRLRRWVDMAARGWYSGETHTHRKVADLPNIILAEDLNVTLPITTWIFDTLNIPARDNNNPDPVPPAELVVVDPTHVFWPINTEYEIFTVAGQQHTLGAFFVLNHRRPFTLTAPPVAPVAEEARQQGGILELDKHNWPWTMMVAKKLDADLYELTNNHLWRTRFLLHDWFPEYAEGLPGFEMAGPGFTEREWLHFGLANYYVLLNCGIRLAPTAGTASGVHPVPLGFGRAYVKVEGEFTYEKWLEGLVAGHSFITTGPMLTAEVVKGDKDDTVQVSGTLECSGQAGGIEIIQNGEVVRRVKAQPEQMEGGGQRVRFEVDLPLESSSWFAVRSIAPADQRPRFAHTAPVFVDLPGHPLRPRKAEVAYLVKRVADELERNTGVLVEEALAEYREVLAHYEGLMESAR